MKLKFLIIAVFITTFSFSQELKFGVIGGLDFNTDDGLLQTVNTVTTDISNFRASNTAGFHIGLFTKIGLAGIYIQPEVLYTNFKSEYTTQNERFDLTTNRIDIPINVGKKVLQIAQIQVGPVFSYHFDDVDLSAIQNLEQEDFSVGGQIGVGVNLSKKITVDARYEFSFGDLTTEFLENNTRFQINERPNLLRLSLSYAF